MSGSWHAEDAGAARTQAAAGAAPTGELRVVRRDAAGAHMALIGGDGAVFAYGTSFGDGMTAWVEHIDAVTLETIERIDGLAGGGPWWPGGFAIHDDGCLHLVHGRWAHRLSPGLEVTASRELPQHRPYNSFVTLPDGTLVTKDFVNDGSACSTLSVLRPDDLAPAGDDVEVPEGSIARLSADGDIVYVIGDHTAFRYRWDGRALRRDETWSFRYREQPDQSYGWDPVIAGGHVWFLDNGDHRYQGTMTGRGVATGPVHLVRVAVGDAEDNELVEVCGLPSGAVTNPPLYDPRARVAVAYDSANGVIAAFDCAAEGPLVPRWRRPLHTAGHLVAFPDDGALMAYDHVDDDESVVFLDVRSGEERARASTGSAVQSVVFPAAADGVVYYTSFTTIARISAG